MKKMMKRLQMILISLLLLFVLGCGLLGGGTREITRFFVLRPLSEPAASAVAPGGSDPLSIGIGPVKLPDSLNRPQMVTRLGENEVRVEPFYRWAAPLSENITAVLVENLSSLLGTNRVVPFPWAVTSRPTYQIRITVVDFMGALGGEATLEARWVLTEGEAPRELVNKRSSFKTPVPSHEHSALVTAQSRLLSDFSREIAQALSRLGKN
ncbi:MAG: PqiC family protein [Pseudomonadota bacterium]